MYRNATLSAPVNLDHLILVAALFFNAVFKQSYKQPGNECECALRVFRCEFCKCFLQFFLSFFFVHAVQISVVFSLLTRRSTGRE